MTPLYKQYEHAAPVGVYTLNNFGGLAILDIGSDGETAVCAWHFGDGYKKIRRHRVYTTYTGRDYIRKNGTRYYFDQIIRMGVC